MYGTRRTHVVADCVSVIGGSREAATGDLRHNNYPTRSNMSFTEDYMREAIALANSAKANGNHPFGAVLVLDDQVVLRAENTVITGHNFTHHAEMNLMNMVAASSLTAEEKARAVLVTSTEPCAMCSGAIVWGGVKKVVYGCPCELLGEIAGDDFLLPCRNLFSLSKQHPVQVEGPILEEEAKSVHVGFWDQH